MHLLSCENSFIILQVQGVFANALSVTFADDFSQLLAALSIIFIEAQVEPKA